MQLSDPLALLSGLLKVPGVTGDETAIVAAAADAGRGLGLEPNVSDDGVWFRVAGTTPGPSFLLTSHLDTVPPGNGWTCDPFGGLVTGTPGHGDRICRGRGAVDARGCCTAMLLALARIRDTGIPGGSVTVAFSIGEEGNRPSLPSLLNDLGQIDGAVVGEPTRMDIAVSQRGLMVLALESKGEQGHAARCMGQNAIRGLAADICALSGVQFPSGLRVTPTRLCAGVADNVTPPVASATFDVRIPPSMSAAGAVDIIAANVRSDLTVISDQWIPCVTDRDHPLVHAAAAAMPAAYLYDSDAASDWVFLHARGVPALKIGPGDPVRSHQPDEWISENELASGIDGYARIAMEFLNRTGRPD